MNSLLSILHCGYESFLRIIGKKTLGARALVIRDNQEILLVKHTYTLGWYTIGGNVKSNESGLEAIVRELYEEAGVIPHVKPKLFGFYYNPWSGRDDYVAFYICQDFVQEKVQSREIAEVRWFSFQNLPSNITPATARRIAEYQGYAPVSDRW